MKNYIKRVFQEPSDSYFLFGPRGTGKSTMVYHRHPEAIVVDLRLANERYKFLANPDLLRDLVLAQPDKTTIVVDEIQKVPDLLPIVHLLIEQKRGYKFILTGSSARKLRRGGVDLMGGRALKRVLHPFMACELGDLFSFSQALEFGLLPLRFDRENPGDLLAAYVALYLEEEVKMEGLTRNYELFTRFLQTMSLSQGAPLNITNIARECHVKRTTVAEWVSILEDLLIGYKVDVFSHRVKRELSAHPKFYFFDAGVYRALRPVGLKDSRHEVDGIALETLVVQHLVAWRDYTVQKHTLSFWRTRAGVEVDFIVFGELGLWGIEVKNSTEVRPNDVRGLLAFKEDYPEAQVVLLYRGSQRVLKQGVLCLPCETFLKQVQPNKPLFVD